MPHRVEDVVEDRVAVDPHRARQWQGRVRRRAEGVGERCRVRRRRKGAGPERRKTGAKGRVKRREIEGAQKTEGRGGEG